METVRRNSAQLAEQVLDWLIATPDLLGVFMGATGADAEDLRAPEPAPELLASVLDFLMLDDAWVLRFCGEAGVEPTRIAEARAGLPGGDRPHWT
ncbi:DUF3572 domain-containing protein [Poseidonocella sedimentorum]|uniref:DUF3572 domain-containing protein n=1 Tax=Poseidonocella sedimentorum TaxID=871652 RepID=A0A1I6E5J2_9RHOB|nr:DUF3572 domain-containing protein [Poseidonocella sedimentorum]SFR12802.1 Protein of unknown function [Poseidonocella sedimentorum]